MSRCLPLFLSCAVCVFANGPGRFARFLGERESESGQDQYLSQLARCVRQGRTRDECRRMMGPGPNQSQATPESRALDSRVMVLDSVLGCFQNATTLAQKANCSTSERIRQAIRNSTGRAEVSQSQMRQAITDAQASYSNLWMGDCQQNNTRRMCEQGLRPAIASFFGTGSSSAGDVTRQMRDQAADGLLDVLRTCNQTEASACIQEVREAWAAAIGVPVSSVTMSSLKDVISKAIDRLALTLMNDCMAQAANSTAQAACRQSVASQISDIKDLLSPASDDRPEREKVMRTLDAVAASEAGNVVANCVGGRRACEDELRERVARARGTAASSLSESDLNKARMDAVMATIVSRLQACSDAGNMSDCQNLYEVFKNISWDERRRSEATGKRELAAKVSVYMKAEGREQCSLETTQAAQDTCNADVESRIQAIMAMFLNLNDAGAQKYVKARAREAEVKAVGDQLLLCVRSRNGTDADLQSCLGEAQDDLGQGPGKESLRNSVLRYTGSMFTTAADNCPPNTTITDCLKDAYDQAVALGMKPREFAQRRDLGLVRGLAEVWAACMAAGGTNLTCAGEVSTRFIELTGLSVADFDMLRERVMAVGDLLYQGNLTAIVYHKSIGLQVPTSGENCSNETADSLLQLINTTLGEDAFPFANISDIRCRKIDGVPTYFMRINCPRANDTAIDTEADAISAALEVSERRLQASGEAAAGAFVAQEVSEEAVVVASSNGDGSYAANSAGSVAASIPFAVFGAFMMM